MIARCENTVELACDQIISFGDNSGGTMMTVTWVSMVVSCRDRDPSQVKGPAITERRIPFHMLARVFKRYHSEVRNDAQSGDENLGG